MKTPKKSESGQSIVILALAMIGMLGFTALAVDGGMAFNERRLQQGSADAAALAGARAGAMRAGKGGLHYEDITCVTGAGGSLVWSVPSAFMDDVSAALAVAESTAIARAQSNIDDSTNPIDHDLSSDDNGVVASTGCTDYGSYIDKYIDVHMMITRDVGAAFVQLFLPDGLASTVTSIARVSPLTPFYYGESIVALREDCSGPGYDKGGVEFGGSDETHVNGGGVYSNACMKINGSPDVTAPSFTYRSEPAPVPAPAHTYYEEDSPPLPRFTIETPNCDALPLNPHTAKDTTDHDLTIYSPGRYTTTLVAHGNYDGDRTRGTKLLLEPGLYCLSNGVKFNGGLIEGKGVTLYLTGGSFETSGGAEIHLSAPTDTNHPNYGIPGILIYLPEGQISPVKLTGNAGSYYIGTVYAPNATCEAAGTTNGMHEFNSQIVCGTVKITGNATINVNNDQNNTYLSDPLLEQNK